MTENEQVHADRIGLVDHSEGRMSRAVRFVKTQGMGEAFRMVRRHGLAGTAAFVTRNLRHMLAHKLAREFDRKHGVDTAGSIQLATLDVVGPNRDLGNERVSTSPSTFRWLMERAPGVLGSTFIDIGAGKSRTLLPASLHDFGRARGVESARELVAVTKDNIEAFRRWGRKTEDVEIIHADVSIYEFAPGPWPPLFDKVLEI